VKACRALTARVAGGHVPADGLAAEVDTEADLTQDAPFARHGFGAQFVEVRVDAVTGEVRVPRLLGVFAVGRIVNPKTARSQLIGGTTMGVSMGLLEERPIDPQFGAFPNHDLATYHVPSCADVPNVEAAWIDEDDPHLKPMGTKGIGEIGIVGTAAAVANAVHHATGVRVRELPCGSTSCWGRYVFLRFSATASRMRSRSAPSSIVSSSLMSIARLTFPSRLELKRPEGSLSDAPLKNVSLTTFV
jgi:xanthine dehydrogenase YagR molybdenum-binding subunit